MVLRLRNEVCCLGLLLIAGCVVGRASGIRVSANVLSSSIKTSGLDKNEALQSVRLAGSVPESVIALLDSVAASAVEFTSLSPLPSSCLLSVQDLAGLLSNASPQLGVNLAGGLAVPVILVQIGNSSPFRNIAFAVHDARKGSFLSSIWNKCPSLKTNPVQGSSPGLLVPPATVPSLIVTPPTQGISPPALTRAFGTATGNANIGSGSSSTQASGSVTTSSLSLITSGNNSSSSAQGQGSAQAHTGSGAISLAGNSGSQVGNGGAQTVQTASIGVNATGPSAGAAQTKAQADSPGSGSPATSDSSAEFSSTQGPVSVLGLVQSQATLGTGNG